MKIVREHINEIKQNIEGSGLRPIGVGHNMVFSTCMRKIINEYNLYYLTEFSPTQVFNTIAYQFYNKIVKVLKCSITDIILIHLDSVDQIEANKIISEIKSTIDETIMEYDDKTMKNNSYHIEVCSKFAIVKNTSKNSFDRDIIIVNNTKYKFFE